MQTIPQAKRILIYGDSLTFGKIPGGLRHDSATRFTGVMQRALGAEYEVIEEGLRGRMTSGENAFFPERDGLFQFGPILGSHLPLDMVILFLGTNDTNSGAKKSPADISSSFEKYVEKIEWWSKHLGFPQIEHILLVAPPIVSEEESYKAFDDFFKGAEAKSRELKKYYQKVASTHNLHFFDSSSVVEASEIDGIHLDEENNSILGNALARKVKEIFSVQN